MTDLLLGTGNDLVTLTGQGFDDGTTLQFFWDQTAGSPVILSQSATSASFTPTVPGEYTFALSVSDGETMSDPVEQSFTVLAPQTQVVAAADSSFPFTRSSNEPSIPNRQALP